jgi:hypothetical protein
VPFAAVVVDHRHAEMQLDVRHIEIGPGFQEAAAFGEIRGHRATALAPVLPDRAKDARQTAERNAGEIRAVGGVAEDEVRMVLQVLADAGQMMHRGDAVACERFAVADTGQHQQMRAMKRARRQDHLAAGAQLADLLALPVLDADRALALEQDARGMRLRLHPQVGTVCDVRMNIAARRAPALAILLRHLVGAETFLLFGVKILADAELRLTRGFQKDLLYRIVGAQSVDGERTALAVIFAVEIGVVFRTFEVRQHVGMRPAAVAKRRPLVVVAAVTADIDHRIDGAGATQPLAARLVAGPAVEAGLRHRLQRPVVDLARHHQHQRAGRGDHPVVVAAASLQQRH